MTEAARTLADEERELFAAATKHDLAAALKHLRNWMSYIDDHHRQKYADLMEAQAKLIAWFVNTRPPLPGTREEVARIIDDDADENALWALATELHSNVPEEKRPMSWSDFSPEQIERLHRSANAFLAALPPAPMPEREGMREALDHMHNARLASIHARADNVRLREALQAMVNDFHDYHYNGCEGGSDNCCFAQILIRDARAALASHDGKRTGACQCCGTIAELTCGPSRFGPQTWACKDCWEPSFSRAEGNTP